MQLVAGATGAEMAPQVTEVEEVAAVAPAVRWLARLVAEAMEGLAEVADAATAGAVKTEGVRTQEQLQMERPALASTSAPMGSCRPPAAVDRCSLPEVTLEPSIQGCKSWQGTSVA